MATNSPPTLLVADAISALSKTLNTVLAKVEDEARVEIARAAAETREALRERDDARKILHDCQLEQQVWKQEVVAWKAAIDKVEMMNQHQTETISQLRQEARQWKDQCLRLEETSRDWKEQFIRVEQERQILLSRIDELVTEKLVVAFQSSIRRRIITYAKFQVQ
jgi:chromosome segregation ATPase